VAVKLRRPSERASEMTVLRLTPRARAMRWAAKRESAGRVNVVRRVAFTWRERFIDTV
jgi:hypothetical protein